MPRFAANLSFMYTEYPFLERFAAAAADGFRAVEYLFPYEYPASELAQQLSMHGLQQVLFNTPAGGQTTEAVNQAWSAGLRGTACLPGQEREFQAGITLALQYAQTLQCPRIHVLAGVLPVEGDHDIAWKTYLENLRWACQQAAVAKVNLLIEPINTRDIPGYFLNHQAQAHNIVDQIGSAHLKIQMDLYHCQIVEGDLATKLRQYLMTGHVDHLQIAGVPGRHEPHIGEIHYPYLFDLIDSLGYIGWIGCEYRPQRSGPGATTAGLSWMPH